MGKEAKKLKRSEHILFKQTGIKCSPTPTENLAICNAGLTTGLSEDIVLKSFEKFGKITDITLVPNKSCAFVSFQEVEDAKTCYDQYNGKLNIAQDNKPIYLLYVNSVPKISGDKIWNEVPNGLIILENFIDDEQEDILLTLPDFNNGSSIKHRQVKHYGYAFNYNNNNVDKDKPLEEHIPQECNALFEKMSILCPEFKNFKPDQLTVNKYEPGQGIPPHVDTHSAFEDPLIILSLGSDIVMDFRNENLHICVILPRKSLVILSGESRYLWTHGITPRTFDLINKNNKCDLLQRRMRISYTFRKIRLEPCKCQYKSKCDVNEEHLENFALENNVAVNLEENLVHKVYENIAEHFSNTRYSRWKNVVSFIETLESGSILFDIGCGNGKYLGVTDKIYNLGCDRSMSLLGICKNRRFETFNCDCLYLPIRDNVADGVICIAVIHHLATEERRLRSIQEIFRILRPGGKALIYVWAQDQKKENRDSTYLRQGKNETIDGDRKELTDILKDLSLPNDVNLPIHQNRTNFKHKDLLVPWELKKNQQKYEAKNTEKTFLRYYHVFGEAELVKICLKVPNLSVEKTYYDEGNHCVIFKKIH